MEFIHIGFAQIIAGGRPAQRLSFLCREDWYAYNVLKGNESLTTTVIFLSILFGWSSSTLCGIRVIVDQIKSELMKELENFKNKKDLRNLREEHCNLKVGFGVCQ